VRDFAALDPSFLSKGRNDRMHPILFELAHHGASRTIGSYGVFVALGVAIAGYGAVRTSIREGMDVGATFVLLAAIAAAGFSGAWITFGVVELARTGTLDAIRSGGGLVFFGAPIGGTLCALWLGPRLGLDVARLADGSVPFLALGHALGRVGCLLGGCCYGGAFDGPWAIVYTHPLAPAAHPAIARHPTQLYEALALFAIAIAFALAGRIGRAGTRAALYAATYCALRFVVELSRGDAIRGVWGAGLSTSQAISLAGLALALSVLALRTTALKTTALKTTASRAGAPRSRGAGSGSGA
jgi:phosphatidylglycerol:prolipoprotein diacylglycerol transferase